MTKKVSSKPHLLREIDAGAFQLPANPPKEPEVLTLHGTSEQRDEELIAQATLESEVLAAQVHRDIAPVAAVSINDMVAAVRQGTAQAVAGDLSRMEAMLVSQAHTLDVLFSHLTRRALLNLGKYPQMVDTYLRLALKAQGQCRATVEALAEIKNPKAVAFVRQANIANGPQQVNNSPAPSSHAGAGETQSPANELSAVTHDAGQRLDTKGTGGTSGATATLEALGEVHRPPNRRRQGAVRAERPQARPAVKSRSG